MQKRRIGVLISGRGSNLGALIEAARDPGYPAEVVSVVSNRPDAKGLELARSHGIPAHVIDHKTFAGRDPFDQAVDRRLRDDGVEIVACAGFMRIMTDGLIAAWAGRMVNIHPSLLPLYRGLDTHARALADGVRIHGCTVHFVTPELDSGPIIAQAAVPVLTGDTPDRLAARVLTAEHRLYPMALALVATGAARLEGGKVRFKTKEEAGAPLFSPQPR
ncbi:MAG: phosphoribosylglycinamide formyltransferase [Parvibaculaceae bacterium]